MILQGRPVSLGTAAGKVLVYKPPENNIEARFFKTGSENEKLLSFTNALKEVNSELDEIINSFGQADQARIFAAHKEMLADEEMLVMVHQAITCDRKEPSYAVSCVFGEFIEVIAAQSDPFFAERAADLKDVRNRLISVLDCREEHNLSDLSEPVIIVAHDLLPSDTATLDRENVLGIITETGGMTSHTAILANNYRIPAILGVPECTNILKDNTYVAMDALEGVIYVEPNAEVLAEIEVKKANLAEKMKAEEMFLQSAPLTADGTEINIGINIGNDNALDQALRYDFVGLFRTEFLYMERSDLPGEEEQFKIYKKILEAANGKPVTIRTLDIGGDKTLSYLPLPKESNPFLGKRALRLSFDKPDIFKTQLRAALRASVYGELWLMFPMVGCMDDIFKAREIFDSVKNDLQAANISVNDNIKVGVMVEIPALSAIADLVAEAVDFASIGTNDLCQYLCAADRMNPDVNDYYQSFSPAMIRTIGFISEQFIIKNKPLSVCGELAGDPLGAVLLVGLGISKLSVSAANTARIKAALAKVTVSEAVQLAEQAKKLLTEKQVIELGKNVK